MDGRFRELKFCALLILSLLLLAGEANAITVQLPLYENGTALLNVEPLVLNISVSGFSYDVANRTFPGTSHLVSSADGTKLAIVEDAHGGEFGHNETVFTSADSGATWTERDGSGNVWIFSLASSADGTKLVLGGYYQNILTSTDSGATWTARPSGSEGIWKSIASSADGTKLAIGGYGGSDTHYIKTSNDSGATWTTQTGSGYHFWGFIVSSADGTKLAAAGSGVIYTSDDSGATWTARTSAGTRNWMNIASSADGSKLVAGTDGGYVYTSTDSGATWTERTSAGYRNWLSLTSSADGTKLSAGTGGNYVYTSTDSGATWTARTALGTEYWGTVVSSSDGTKLSAEGIFVYQLTDSEIADSCDVALGTHANQTLDYSNGWCTGTLSLTDAGFYLQPIRAYASDSFGNHALNDSYSVIILPPIPNATLLSPPDGWSWTTENFPATLIFSASCSGASAPATGEIWSNISGSWEPLCANDAIENATSWDCAANDIPEGTWKIAAWCNETYGFSAFSDNATISLRAPVFELLFDTIGGNQEQLFHSECYEGYCSQKDLWMGNAADLSGGCVTLNRVSFPFLGSSVLHDCSAVIAEGLPLSYVFANISQLNNSIVCESLPVENITSETNFTFWNGCYLPFDSDTSPRRYTAVLDCANTPYGITDPVLIGANTYGERGMYFVAWVFPPAGNIEGWFIHDIPSYGDTTTLRILGWGRRWGAVPDSCCGYIRNRELSAGNQFASMGEDVSGLFCGTTAPILKTVIVTLSVIFLIFLTFMLVRLAGG